MSVRGVALLLATVAALLAVPPFEAAPKKAKRTAAKQKIAGKPKTPITPADDPRWAQHPVLSRLKELRDAKLSPVQRARIGFRLLRDELVQPTRNVPPYTDYLTHDYVLAQITRRLAETDTDLPAIKTAWEGTNPGHFRDCLTLCLALKDEPGMKEPIVELVSAKDKLMRLREMAITILGKMAIRDFDSKVGDVLFRALRDGNQSAYRAVPPSAENPEGALYLVFPLRRAAAEAIREMDKQGLLLASYVTRAAETVQFERLMSKPPPAVPATVTNQPEPPVKPKTAEQPKEAVKPKPAPNLTRASEPRGDDPRWEQHPVLSRLKELRDPKLSPVQRARIGQRLLRDELVEPTRVMPPYTDYVTHDYVLAQIIRRLAETNADVSTIKAARDGAEPGEMRDSLTVFLALKDQPDLKEALVELVSGRGPLMRLREMAATILGKIAVKDFDGKLGEVLAKVAQEDNHPAYRVVPPSAANPEETIFAVFPVRRAAADAIKEMNKKGLLLSSYVTRAAETVQFEIVLPKSPKKN